MPGKSARGATLSAMWGGVQTALKGGKERKKGRKGSAAPCCDISPRRPRPRPLGGCASCGRAAERRRRIAVVENRQPQVNVPAPDEPPWPRCSLPTASMPSSRPTACSSDRGRARALHWFIVDFAQFDAAAKKAKPVKPQPPPTPASLEARLAEREAEERSTPTRCRGRAEGCELREKMRRTLDPEAAAEWDATARGGRGEPDPRAKQASVPRDWPEIRERIRHEMCHQPRRGLHRWVRCSEKGHGGWPCRKRIEHTVSEDHGPIRSHPLYDGRGGRPLARARSGDRRKPRSHLL
jgi:hypothetical protein